MREGFERVCLGGAAEGAIGEPRYGDKHAEPADGAGGVGDLRVVQHQVPLGEEDFPVAVTRGDKKKRAGAGVGHVGADVEKIFEKPERAEGGAGGFATEKEISDRGQRNDELEQRAAENHECVSEAVLGVAADDAEEWMAGFVDHEIGEIEEEETGAIVGGVEKKEKIEGDGNEGDWAGDGLPFFEGNGGPFHETRVARVAVEVCGFEGGVSIWTTVMCIHAACLRN